jgi:hypothetical protein
MKRADSEVDSEAMMKRADSEANGEAEEGSGRGRGNLLVVVNSYEKWSVLLRDDVEWKRGWRRNENKGEGWSCGFNDTSGIY